METFGMSEEAVDIHIRLSADGAKMLEDLMALGKYTSKSAYIEQLIMATEDIFAAFYTFHKLSKMQSSAEAKQGTWSMFTQYLLAVVRRLGWVEYRDLKDAEEKLNKVK